MPKTIKSATYSCNACGAVASTWSGRCPLCGEWNSLEIAADSQLSGYSKLTAKTMSESINSKEARLETAINGVDQVFGGGIVAGSVNLISGEPGMGKSTLLLQICAAIANKCEVLYVSGEESLHQVGMRAKRLNLTPKHLKIAATNSTDDISREIESGKFKLVVVDSIQTVRCLEVGSSAGSISQVTNSSALLARAAKQSNTAVILVGHITKEGNIAGPKLLEHIVDVVLSLEGDQSGGLKLLRVSKNRFGSTNETAIFEMKQTGLIPVINPSAILLAERKITDGSIVLATMEGSRPILVEVQALVNPTSYGYPKRAASGLDLSRLNLLLAMMERRTSLKLNDKDVYVNLVGGLRLNEPAGDLAIVMAVASAARGKKLNSNAVVFGEVGLSGEIRHVPFIDKRLAEARALGFEYAIGPKTPGNKSSSFLQPVIEVKQALNTYLS